MEMNHTREALSKLNTDHIIYVRPSNPVHVAFFVICTMKHFLKDFPSSVLYYVVRQLHYFKKTAYYLISVLHTVLDAS